MAEAPGESCRTAKGHTRRKPGPQSYGSKAEGYGRRAAEGGSSMDEGEVSELLRDVELVVSRLDHVGRLAALSVANRWWDLQDGHLPDETLRVRRLIVGILVGPTILGELGLAPERAAP